jgi:hypothetical protein
MGNENAILCIVIFPKNAVIPTKYDVEHKFDNLNDK